MTAPFIVIALLLGINCCVDALHSSLNLMFDDVSVRVPRRATIPLRVDASSDSSVTLPEIDNKAFWFANFTVGAAKDLLLLIDTGSSDVYLNPSEYSPGKGSKNLHKNFSITFDTTSSSGSGSETLSGPLYRDLVASGALSIPNQELGVQSAPNKPAFPHDGLVGFASKAFSAFKGRPWIHSLCAEKKIDECRFGLAFRTDKTGTQTIGGVDKSKFNGALTTAPILDEWALRGDIVVNGKVFREDQEILTDSGTTVVYGPLLQVRRIYKKLGIQSVLYPGSPTYLKGYFPCDKPPTFGFGFPSTGDAANATGSTSSTSKIFNINGKAMAFHHDGDNNCTAALQGTNAFGGAWLVGQAFFQSHYIDHNIKAKTMGFADLA